MISGEGARVVPLLGATVALVAIGVLFIYSSGVDSTGVSVSQEWIKQIVWAMTGFALLALVAVLQTRAQ